jgi:HK97 family phage major capsid protein
MNDRSASSATTDNLWGLPVVVTTSATVGTAVVGAFNTCAEVFRKGGITVEATNSNENDFLTNLIAIRAEERLALAVYRPAGFSTVTGL